MNTPPAHDASLHDLSTLYGGSGHVPGCPGCAAAHRARGWRLLAALSVLAAVAAAAVLTSGWVSALLGALVWVGLCVPVGPLSRWLETGSSAR